MEGNLLGGDEGVLSGEGMRGNLSGGIRHGNLSRVKNIPLSSPPDKGGADEVNTLSLAHLCKGGVSRRLTGGLIASV